jgi:hypothetical protein
MAALGARRTGDCEMNNWCHRCLEEGRKRYSYFDIGGVPICIPCFLWEDITPAEQKRWDDYNIAHAMVSSAKASGKLIEQPCEICGSILDIEAHHEDHSNYMTVRWLCQFHHRQVTYGRLKLASR